MTSRRDPLGKRALFSDQTPEASPAQRRPTDGKRALFSAEDQRPWTVSVHCSSCDTRTTLSAVGFVVQHLPAWMWVPWKRDSHLMRCPSCGKLAWHSASLGRSSGP